MEIKIKWIKRKQMTHENTYRDDKLIIVQIYTIVYRHSIVQVGPLTLRLLHTVTGHDSMLRVKLVNC